jgi:Flp pilus assembly protein TadG
MSTTIPRNAARALAAFSRRFKRDRNGVAAVEFAMIAPVLLLILLGCIEISRMISMDRRLGIVTHMTADLIAREKELDAAGFKALMNSIEHVMRPYDATSLGLRMIEVGSSATNPNDTRVFMSFAHNTTQSPLAACAAYKLPTTGLLGVNAFAVVVETTYTYTPLFAQFITGPMTWTDRSVQSPRHSCVNKVGATGSCTMNCSS